MWFLLLKVDWEVISLTIVEIKDKGAFQIGGSFVYFPDGTKFFKATLLKEKKSSCIKIMIGSTDFEVNIFNLTSMVQQIHLLQTIEGKEKTLLLVAIGNFVSLLFIF